MKRTRVSSSNIYSVGHSSQPDNEDETPDTLEIEFSGTGAVWSYHPVSAQRFNALMGAESIGRYFNTNIKNADGIRATRVE